MNNNFLILDFKKRLADFINLNFKEEKDLVDLAQHLKITRGSINRWRNHSLMPKVPSLAKICLLTNVSLDFLIFENNNKFVLDNLYYNEEEFKKNLFKILETTFSSNYDISKKLKISHLTPNTWKTKNTLPSIPLLARLSLYTNIPITNIVLNNKGS